jgi:hypothetical protein
MKDIIQMQIAIRDTNSSMANMINIHTYTACGANLIVAVVLVVDVELFEVACNMVGGAGISVPICVDSVGVRVCCSIDVLLIKDVVLVEAVPATLSAMPLFVAHVAPSLKAFPLSTIVRLAVRTASSSIATSTAIVALAAIVAALIVATASSTRCRVHGQR